MSLRLCVLTGWWAVLIISAGPWVSGSSRAGAYCSTGDSLSNSELQLYLLCLRKGVGK